MSCLAIWECMWCRVWLFGWVYVVSCLAIWECMWCRVWLLGSVCSVVFGCLGSAVCCVVFGVYVVSCLAVWECM